MITFNSRTSLPQIEELRNRLSEPEASILRLPKHLELGGAFGIPIALVQFVADWNKRYSDTTLQLFFNPEDTPSLSEFAGTPQGMLALYFSHLVKGSRGNELKALNCRFAIIPYVEAMQSFKYDETIRGRGTFLCCFASARNEFLQPLYKLGSTTEVRGRSDFRILINQILQKTAPEAIHRLSTDDLENLSLLIYELFSNTDDHARQDEYGNLIAKGARGIYLKFIPQGFSNSLRGFNYGDTSLNRFFLHSLTEEKSHKQSYSARSYLEISVFDTGPGLAKRWISSTDSSISGTHLDEEFSAVHKCFSANLTTKNTYGKGHGLSNVIDSLRNLKAYMRLRTGRLCLVKDFSKVTSNYVEEIKKERFFEHWQPKHPLLSNASGAVYTIFVPLGINRK